MKKKLSTSPERFTFGQDDPKEFVDIRKAVKEYENTPEFRKNNLEYDLRTNEYMLKKVRESDKYARALYAAMCNNEFQKLEVMPILKSETWMCSWRHAGGIIADMREQGDYIEWYCSGNESEVTEEVREDLKKLGWAVKPL